MWGRLSESTISGWCDVIPGEKFSYTFFQTSQFVLFERKKLVLDVDYEMVSSGNIYIRLADHVQRECVRWIICGEL